LFKTIPEATYGKIILIMFNINLDTGDGYYDIEKGTIFTYEGEFLRVPNEEEVIILIFLIVNCVMLLLLEIHWRN